MLTALFSKRPWGWTGHFSCMVKLLGWIQQSGVVLCVGSSPPSTMESSHDQILCHRRPMVLTPSIWLTAEHIHSSSGICELRKESTTSNSLFLSLNIIFHGTAFFLSMVVGSRVYRPSSGIFDMSFASTGTSFCSFHCKLVTLSRRSANIVELAWTCVSPARSPSFTLS